MAALATRERVRGALLAVSLLACDSFAALPRRGRPPPPATAAAPAAPAGPQQTTPQSEPPPPASADAPQAQPAPAEKRGFFDDLSRWWNDSVADFNAKLKEQQSKIDDFNKKSAEAAKGAAAAGEPHR